MSAEIKEIFLQEAKDLLNSLESDIIRLEGEFDRDLFNNVFRCVHTLKGSSGVAGYTSVYEYAHQLENLMDLVRSDQLDIGENVFDVLLDSLDWFKLAIYGDEDEVREADGLKETLLDKIYACINTGVKTAGSGDVAADDVKPDKASEYNYYKVIARFRENICESGIDPMMIIEDLVSQGTVIYRKVDKSKLPPFREIDPTMCYFSWEIVIKSTKNYDEIMDIFMFVKDDNEIEVHDVTGYFNEGDINTYSQEVKVGEILVNRGIITEDELEDVIQSQEKENRKLGDLIVEKGYATESDMKIALNEQDKIRKKMDTGTLRVDTVKLDSIMNLLGEIVIGQSTLKKMAEELHEESAYRLKNALYGLDRITREFQEQLMSIRMIQVGPTFEQFRRFVRDQAKAAGKEINFEIEGKETELDKTVIEKIGDPLKHMIRNSIDHGLETADEREKAGKPRAGTLSLRAFHQEGSVIIEVSDDGRGINPGKIRKKAIEKGFLDEKEEASESRLYSFLFRPGFSTAEKVGELSGRGVGMDVVKTNIESLRGTIDIISQMGGGTMVRIKLPLTLAIIEGMLVRVGSYTYIIPLLSILESIQPDKNSLKTVEGKGEVILHRGEYVTLVRLYDFFKIQPDFEEPWDCLVVISESAGEKVGIMVDELLGQQQIVIKSFDNDITVSRAISGASVLGDGNVALILDIHGFISELAK